MSYSGRREGLRAIAVDYSPMCDFNPTNLAVQKSLMEIFDEFTEVITGELRYTKFPEKK